MEEKTEKIPEDWPQSMIDLAMVIGVASTERLMAKHPGQRIYVPRKMADHHRLVGLLGKEVAYRLSKSYGGDQLLLCLGTKAKRRRRDQEIIRRFDAGELPGELAVAFDLTTRQIFNILKQTF
ncbi:MAG: hypothetical protein HQL72_04215 [Magnetococcales bacterium]|nr:hypothetical protein [Magnetococcales bacterium]